VAEPHDAFPDFRAPFLSRGTRAFLAGFVLIVGGLVFHAWWTHVRMPGRSYAGPLAPLSPEEGSLRDRLRAHVVMLASTIGPRSTMVPAGLQRATTYVAEALAVGAEPVVRETFVADGIACHNLVLDLPGRTHPREIVVIGAHYDAVLDRPGANDNGSGTAAILELARVFVSTPRHRTLRFVAFTNEEPRHFQTTTMGSLVHARRSRARGDDVVAMLSLETIGYYDTRPNTQHYPFPLSIAYPDRGDFIAFVGSTEMAPLVRLSVAAFRAHTAFPSEGTALSAKTPGIGWSDHWSFWQTGYPAIMVTDSAPYRDPNYHTMRDTPDTLDYHRMTRVVLGLVAVVHALDEAPRTHLHGD